MLWSIPQKIKVYEALGTLADNRLELDGNSAKSYSSSHAKFYTITFDPAKNAIMCNDNASYYVGTLGYPAIAFLMAKGILSFDPKYAELFKEIPWKDLNQKFKNNFSKTEEYILNSLALRDVNIKELSAFADKVIAEIKALKISKLGPPLKPPEGY